MRGVLDRIEEGLAVILIEEAGKQFTLPENELPAGSEIGTSFTIAFKNNQYTIIAIDEAETKRTSEKSARLMQQLQQKKKRSKFKRR